MQTSSARTGGAVDGDAAQRPGCRWRVLPRYVLGGLAWGVAARGWMRLLASDPEFTWGGTIAILIIATLAWTGGGIAAATRTGRPAARRVGTVAGTILCLVLGLGQGMLLLPTALAGGAVVGRSPMRRWVRFLLVAIAVAPIVVLVVAIWQEGKHSLLRVLVIAVATPLLCRALCVPYAALLAKRRHMPA